jgi:hypothetical protein
MTTLYLITLLLLQTLRKLIRFVFGFTSRQTQSGLITIVTSHQVEQQLLQDGFSYLTSSDVFITNFVFVCVILKCFKMSICLY